MLALRAQVSSEPGPTRARGGVVRTIIVRLWFRSVGVGGQKSPRRAFEGQWTRRLLERADAHGLSDLRVHAFEPERAAADQLRETTAHDDRVEVHPFGLAAADRVELMTLAGPGSSVFHNPAAGSMGTAEVPLRDVDAVLSALDVDRIDLAKINIEGGEFEVIDRLHETGWLSRTGTLIVQFHEFAPGAHRARRRNRRHLARTHVCTWCYPWVFERWDPR